VSQLYSFIHEVNGVIMIMRVSFPEENPSSQGVGLLSNKI